MAQMNVIQRILVCPEKMLVKQRLAVVFMVTLLIDSAFICKSPLVLAVLLFAFECRFTATSFSPPNS